MTSHKLHSVQQYFDPENGWCVGIDDIIKSTVFCRTAQSWEKLKLLSINQKLVEPPSAVTLSGPLQHIDSLLLPPFSRRSAAVLAIIGARRCPGVQAQIISYPPPCLTGGAKCLCSYVMFGCLVLVVLHCSPIYHLWCCLTNDRGTLKFSTATLPIQPSCFSVFSNLLLWIITFNMLTEAHTVWNGALGVLCSYPEHRTVWALGEFAGVSTPGKTVVLC